MNDMKCPFCGKELDTGNYYVHCHNPQCNITVDMEGTEEMWNALIRTKKQLEIAVDALKLFCGEDVSYYSQSKIDARDARTALEQITALEPKETPNA